MQSRFAGESHPSFAVTVTRVEGRWWVRKFADSFGSVATSVGAVRALRSTGPAFALLCIEDDYFAIIRPTPGGVTALLSDALAAVEDDFAAAVLDEIGAEIPDVDQAELEDADPWAEGSFDILADLGLSEEVLAIIAEDPEAWASEQLIRIAEELGFDEELIEAADLDV